MCREDTPPGSCHPEWRGSLSLGKAVMAKGCFVNTSGRASRAKISQTAYVARRCRLKLEKQTPSVPVSQGAGRCSTRTISRSARPLVEQTRRSVSASPWSLPGRGCVDLRQDGSGRILDEEGGIEAVRCLERRDPSARDGVLPGDREHVLCCQRGDTVQFDLDIQAIQNTVIVDVRPQDVSVRLEHHLESAFSRRDGGLGVGEVENIAQEVDRAQPHRFL